MDTPKHTFLPKAKTVGLTLIVLGLLLIVIGPKQLDVVVTQTISGSPKQVFPYFNNLRVHATIDAWTLLDPTMKLTYTNPESGLGASQDWKSNNSRVGSGTLTITQSIPQKFIKYQLTFGEAGGGTAKITLLADNSYRYSKVRYHFIGDETFNPIGIFFNWYYRSEVQQQLKTTLNNLEYKLTTSAKIVP